MRTRSPTEHDAVLLERAGLERLDVVQTDWDSAQAVQRRAAGIPDLLIAAVAARHRVTVLHDDRDFDHIAAVTSQPVQWIVSAGSVR